jgi:hypothetical protein
MLETFQERRDPAAGGEPEPLHDPLRLDHGEALPCAPIRLDRRTHPMRVLDGLEPQPVVSKPVLGIVHHDADELVLAELP